MFFRWYTWEALKFFSTHLRRSWCFHECFLDDERENQTFRKPERFGALLNFRTLLCMEVMLKVKSGDLEFFDHIHRKTHNLLARAFGARDVFAMASLGRRAKNEPFASQCVWRTFSFVSFVNGGHS